MPDPSYLVFHKLLPHGGFEEPLSHRNCYPIFQTTESGLHVAPQLVHRGCDAEKSARMRLHIPQCLWGRAEPWAHRKLLDKRIQAKLGVAVTAPFTCAQNRGPSPLLLGYLSGKKSDMRRHFFGKRIEINKPDVLTGGHGQITPRVSIPEGP